MKLFPYSFITVIIVIFMSSSDAVRPKGIITNKCCGEGERLSENYECIPDENDDWWPLILMVKKNTYFNDIGRAPKFMDFQKLQPTCENREIYIGQHKLALFTNGTLYLSEKHKFIEPKHFCIDRDAAIICDPSENAFRASKKLSKIRKCCVKKTVYSATSGTCVPIDGFDFSDTKYDIVFGFPECNVSNLVRISESFNESNFDRDLNSLTLKTGHTLEWREFCIDHIIDNKNETVPHIGVYTCADHSSEKQNAYSDIRFILVPIGLLISVVFLLATLALRYIIPQNHHHILHRRCQTYYISCLLLGDFLLAFTHLLGRNVTGFACISIAVCMHFFFLSAFFWLNCMCFNIYLTFRDFRPTSLERTQEKVRLRIYKIYAWGVPLLIAGIAATLDHMQKNSLTEDVYLQPRFCEKEYWFTGNLAKLAYFYGPIAILLLINFALFASTTRQLTCGLWKREEVKSTTERTTLGRICIKLVIVMGVTWLADVLSWAHGVWFNGYNSVWIITDLINALQGVFIFIVIGCQPQVSSVLKQIWRSKNIQCRHETAEGGQHNNSNSSQVASSMGESITNNTFTTSNAKMLETAC